MKSKNSEGPKKNTLMAKNENRFISDFKKCAEVIPQVSTIESEINLQ